MQWQINGDNVMQLRNYQENQINNIRNLMIKGHKRIVVQASTGSGKTVMFSHIVKNASENNNNCLIVTDRIELLSQAGGTFEKIGLIFCTITAGNRNIPVSKVCVGMVETLKRRLKKRLDFQMYMKRINILIIDEAHKNTFNELFAYISENCYVLGFTATPIRFGKMPELGKYFSIICEGESISNLIDSDYLANPKYYGVPVDLSNVHIKKGEFDENDLEEIYKSNEVFGGLATNLNKHANGKKCIIFCPTIETSKQVARELGCLHVDGNMNKYERHRILHQFETNPQGIISNVGILTTGYDHPQTECIVLYRATKSLPLYLQMIGRGSRVTESKLDFLILDFGNNILRHNFWHEDRIWKLKNDTKRKVRADRESVYPIKDCPQCGALIPVNVKTCEYCGHIWTIEEQERRIIELQEMEYGKLIKKIFAGMSISEMEEIRKARKYKQGWLFHQFTEPEQFIEYGKFMRYHPKWAYYKIEYFLKNAENNMTI